MKLKVGFLGPEGTFCEEASNIYITRVEGQVELIPYGTIHDLLFAVEKRALSEGIVPIENSIEGTVSIVTDMLAKEVNLRISQEIILPISQNLIAPKGTVLKKITHVISHPQAIDQCRDFLRKKLPKAQVHLAYSTADAVKQVAGSLGEKLSHVFAAIGTKQAARLYDLNILAANINQKGNQTRFIVVKKKDHIPTGDDKTSIVFTMPKDKPGGLYEIMGEFALREINLTKIESRPAKKSLGDYLFFLDLQGHREDKKVKDALRKVENKAAFYKLLGSYPLAKGASK